MAWRTPTVRDLAAKLNQAELDSYRAHPDFKSDADPVLDLLAMTAESVRNFCRTNKTLRMSPHAGTIPEGLMSFAMDVAAWDVITRIGANVPGKEERKAKWEKALEWFEKVSRGELTPESWSEDEGGDTASNRALPAFGSPKVKILNKYPMI